MIHKIFRLSANYEKEEQWLNQMASRGMNFVNYSPFVFTFKEGTPGEYIYRIELLENVATHPESIAYIRFMEESGVECVNTHFRWVYFRRKAAEGSFDLFTDLASRRRHYRSVITLLGVVSFLNLCAAIINLSIWFFSTRLDVNIYAGAFNFIIFLLFTPSLVSHIKRYKKMKRENTVYQ